VPSSGHAWRCGAAALHERPSLQRRPLAPSAALSLELHRGPRSPGPPPGAHREHRLPRRAGRRPLHDAGAGGGARVPALHAGPRCQVAVVGPPRPGSADRGCWPVQGARVHGAVLPCLRGGAAPRALAPRRCPGALVRGGGCCKNVVRWRLGCGLRICGHASALPGR
ncbi:unnamed protein product, partial [Prorocentrum cordatum]